MAARSRGCDKVASSYSLNLAAAKATINGCDKVASSYSLNLAAAKATINPNSSAVANNKKNDDSTLHTSLAAATILLSVTVRGNTQKITS